MFFNLITFFTALSSALEIMGGFFPAILWDLNASEVPHTVSPYNFLLPGLSPAPTSAFFCSFLQCFPLFFPFDVNVLWDSVVALLV